MANLARRGAVAVNGMDNRSYYDEFAAGYENERGGAYHRMLDDLEVELVARYGTGRDVLEVGCGTGLLLGRMGAFAATAVGVDLSPGMLAKAKDRGLDVREGDATSLPFADQSFDVVCAFKVLAHVEDIERALAECARVVRPGGWVLAEFYNKHSLRWLVKRLKPATSISQRVDDEAVFTRYDTPQEIAAYLPPSLQWVTSRGVRIFTPAAGAHRLPLVGPWLRHVEGRCADLPLVREAAGFYIACCQRV